MTRPFAYMAAATVIYAGVLVVVAALLGGFR